jgi:ubiquinone/menaquinone biosynthesis C-methylase UbiE
MHPDKLGRKYHGNVAATYDARREQSPGWWHQQRTVERYLSTLPAGSRVLDVPVGTGRFLEAYGRHGLDAIGVDISSAMLSQARAKMPDAELYEGSIMDLPFADGSFDCVVCMRFLNWVGGAQLDRAVSEIARVSRGTVICNIRMCDPVISLFRRLRQWKLRLYYIRTRNTDYVFHDPGRVADLFQRHKLRIISASPGPHGKLWRNGMVTNTYVLEVAP